MVNDTTHVAGAKALSDKLQELGAQSGGKALRNAALYATTPIRREAMKRIPESDTAHRLHKSYGGRLVAPGFAKRHIKKRTRLGKNKHIVWADVGVTPEAFYATAFVERGTAHQPAQPWLEPSFRAKKREALERLSSKLKRTLIRRRRMAASVTASFAALLRSNPAIVALATDIRPQVLTDDAEYPALTYHLASDEAIRTMDDFASIRQADFIVNSYGPHYDQVKALAETVRLSLEGYSGNFGDHYAEQIDAIVDFDRHLPTEKNHSVSQTYTVWYTTGSK